jgi:hypothetical protein
MFADRLCGDTSTSGDGQFFAMPAEQVHLGAVGVKDLRDQQAEFPVAQDGHLFAFGDFDLIENFAGGGNRLDEDGVVVGNRFRNAMKVPKGQGEEFAERAGMFHDAEHGSLRTMPAELARAPFAMSAGEIDFAGYAFAGIDHLADEFVPRRSAKAVIAALEFEVGGADAGGEQADSGETFGHTRQRPAAKFHAARFEMNGEHDLTQLPIFRAIVETPDLLRLLTRAVLILSTMRKRNRDRQGAEQVRLN